MKTMKTKIKQEEITPSPLFEGIDAARFIAAMFHQSESIQPKNAAPVYLDKNNPIVRSIKGRAITDLRQSTKYMDPESIECQAFAERSEALTEERKNQFQALNGGVFEKYAEQAYFDYSLFMLVFAGFNEMDKLKIPEEWDIRVQQLAGDNYIAEFWEDSHIVQPEAKNEIGEKDRYYKMMALMYSLEKDGKITFHDPFQTIIDFLS